MKSRFLFSLLCAVALVLALCGGLSAAQHRVPRIPPTPIVLTFTTVRAQDAVRVLRRLYPQLSFTIDGAANAVVVLAGSDDAAALRQIGAAIDTKNPLTPVTASLILHRLDANQIAARLHGLYPSAKLAIINRHTLLVSAVNSDLQQMQSLVAAIDQPPQTPTPRPAPSAPDTEAVPVLQASPRTIAREVAGAVHGLRVGVAGHTIVLAGAPDLVARAKDVISVLDTPSVGARYTAVYRLRTLDAQSVGDLISRSYPNAKVTVDAQINSLSVSATPAEQRRIAEGIAQLDALPSPGPGAAGRCV